MSILLPVRWDRSRALTLADIRGWRAISYTRFSAHQQRDGDSVPRQQANQDRAISRLELILDHSMVDAALSASKGHHRTKGNLGHFLVAVEAGEIPPGTVLLVESICRLTREGPLDVYPMLKTLIRAGIVLLVCGETEDDDDFDLYDEHAINEGKGDKLHAQICASRDYARKLSKRSKAKHARRREQAEHGEAVIPNGRPPFWINRDTLERTRGGEVHTLNEGRTAVLAMFEYAERDMSVREIADALRKRGLTGPDGRPFRATAIGRILRDDAVLGYWTPIQWMGKKRVPVGRAYRIYPEAIPPGLWESVQRRLDARAGVLRGSTGKAVPNLFTRRVHCGSCGGRLRLDTGGGLRNGVRKRHLICSSYVEHQGCDDGNRYDLAALERPLLLALLERLRVAPEGGRVPSEWSERSTLLELNIAQLDEAIQAMLPRVGSSATLAEHVVRLGREADEKRAELKIINERRAAETNHRKRSEETWRFVRGCIGPALNGDVAARERLRLRLATHDFKITGDGSGRMMLRVGQEALPIPPCPGMVLDEDPWELALVVGD